MKVDTSVFESRNVFCSAPFQSDLIGGFEPNPRCSDTTKSLYQKHAEAISIKGKPLNIYKFNAIPLQNMHLTKNGILCRYNIISKIVLRYRYKNNFGVELLLFTKQC